MRTTPLSSLVLAPLVVAAALALPAAPATAAVVASAAGGAGAQAAAVAPAGDATVTEVPLALAAQPVAARASAAAPSGHDHSDAPSVLLGGELDTASFSTVGVTWAPAPGLDDVHVGFRTRTDGAWSGWTDVEAHGAEAVVGAPEEGRAGLRSGSDPFYAGESDGVQVRVEVHSGGTPTDLRLVLVDVEQGAPVAGASAASLQATAAAVPGMPPIRSRSQWGADERINTGSPSYASTLEAVTIHHTVSRNDYAQAEVPGILKGIHEYHVRGNGWSDVGYNVLVDRFGTAWEGRAGGLDRPVIGAHAGGFNTGTAGVSMIGDLTRVPASGEMLSTAAKVAAWKLGTYGRDPGTSVVITSGGSNKYAAGTRVTLPRVFSHRDVGQTSCPGMSQAQLNSIRAEADRLVGTPTQVEPFGSLDAVTAPDDGGAVRVVGWAHDPDLALGATTSLQVELRDQGVAPVGIATVQADARRDDVQRLFPSYRSSSGFDDVVPGVTPGRHTVCVRLLDQGAGSDLELGCQEVEVLPVAVSTATPVVQTIALACPSAPPSGFSDAGGVHSAAIDCVKLWEVATGVTASSYAPTASVTRAQMAQFLARLVTQSGGTLPAAGNAFDDDAGLSADASRAIEQLAAAGVLRGTGGRTYSPSATVGRGQMATFLAGTYAYLAGTALPDGEDYFRDDDGNVHEANIGRVTREGIAAGVGSGRYGPNGVTTRGQMASFLSRLLSTLVEDGKAQPR